MGCGASVNDPDVKVVAEKLKHILSECDKLRENIQNFQKTSMIAPSEEEMKNLHSGVKSLKDQKEDLTKQLEHLLKENEMGLEDKLNYLAKELEKTDHSISHTASENDHFKHEIHRLTEEHEDYKKKNHAENERHGQLNTQLSTKKDQISKKSGISHELNESNEKYTELCLKHERNLNEISSLHGSIVEIEDLGSLESDIIHLKSEISALHSKVADFTEKNSGFEDIESLEGKFSANSEAIPRKNNEFEHLRSEKETIASEIVSLTSKNAELEGRISGFSVTADEVGALHNRKEELETFVNNAHNNINSDENELNELKNQEKELLEKIEKLRKHRGKARGRYQKHLELETLHEEISGKYKGARKQLEEYKERIKLHKESLKTEDGEKPEGESE